MINFIIVESDDIFLAQLKDEIDIIMLAHKIAYKTYTFTEFSNQFMILVKINLENKIYILNIKINGGLQSIRYIRGQNLYDFIILLDSFGVVEITDRLLILDIISRFNMWKIKLKEATDMLVIYILSNGNLVLRKMV